MLLDVASEASEASCEAEPVLVKYCHILGCRIAGLSDRNSKVFLAEVAGFQAVRADVT